jgi:hypothetical protein
MLNSSFKQMDDFIYTVFTKTYYPGLNLARGCPTQSFVCVFFEHPVSCRSSGISLGLVRRKISLVHQL